MAEPQVKTGGTCPACNEGTLVKNTITKLECTSCGWEAIVEPKDSDTFVKPSPVGATLEKVCFYLIIALLIFLMFGDKIL